MTRPTLLVLALLAGLSCVSDYDLRVGPPDVHPSQVTECDFTAIEGTKISRYNCNPVFTNTDEDWGGEVGAMGFHVTEVLGHPFYQMWYVGFEGVDYGLGYAASANGTDWVVHDDNPLLSREPGAWDEDSLSGQAVVWDPIDQQYVMAYQGFSLGDPTSMEDDIWGVGVATSPDGFSWERHPSNPVIDFLDYGITQQDYWNYFCIERASSTVVCDLIGWTYNPNYTLSSQIKPCWPLTINLTDRGAFRGYLAASSTLEILEGLDWETFEAEIWAGNEAWIQVTENAACNIYGMDGVSLDTWLIDEEAPVLAGTPGSHDGKGVTGAAVVEYGDTLYMFYLGFQLWAQSSAGAGVITAMHSTLNLATSTDGGVTWEKDPNNPQPVHLTDERELWSVGAQVVGSRIHLWITDRYEGGRGVGYFYYEPGLDSLHGASP